MAMAISSTVTRWSRCSEALLTAAVVWRGRHTITTSHQTANYEFEWPSSKTHLSLSLLLLLLRERNVHFCIDFSSNKPNIHQFVSEHWIWCFSLCIWPRKRPFRKSFLSPQMTNDFVFPNSNFRLDFCGKIFLLIFKLHFDECRVKSFGKYGLMMQQIWN